MKIFLIFAFSALLSAQSTPEIVPVDKEPMHRLTFENEYVRVFVVEVPVNSQTKFHQHDRDYMFVTLGDSEVESERVNEMPVRLTLKDGEARFTKGGFAHKARNANTEPFRNVTIELKSKITDTGKYLHQCMGGACIDQFLDSANTHCSRYTGNKGAKFGLTPKSERGKYAALVIRPGAAVDGSELVEVTTKGDSQSLISFYKADEVPEFVSGDKKERTDFTACAFTPLQK